MDSVPPEIRDIIYHYWSIQKLATICSKHSINFGELSKFLQNNRGFIYGPIAVRCLGFTWISSGINLLIISDNLSKFSESLSLIFDTDIYFTLPTNGDSIFTHECLTHNFDGFYIDIRIVRPSRFRTPKMFLRYISIIDHFGIAFDGSSWISTLPSMRDHVEGNFVTIINAINNDSYHLNEGLNFLHFVRKVNSYLKKNPITGEKYEIIERVLPEPFRELCNKFGNHYAAFTNAEICISHNTFCMFKNDIVEKLQSQYTENCVTYISKAFIGLYLTNNWRHRIFRLFSHIFTYTILGFKFTNLSKIKILSNPNVWETGQPSLHI